MKHYQIRFNTKAEPGDPLVWRVIADGEERLASSVLIMCASFSEESEVEGVTKWNMACNGVGEWQGDKIVIW